MILGSAITTGDWFSLAGALGSILAAGIAVVALWKVRDERRRTFKLTVLIEISNALGEPGVDTMNNERLRTLLHMVPVDWFPVMKVRLGVDKRATAQAAHDEAFVGVNQYYREARAITVTREEVGSRAAALL